jgi:hypothetical protein
VSNADFKRNFSALLKRVGDRAEMVVRGTALGIGGSVAEKSPVDTGRFKNNWMTALDSIDASANARADASGASSRASLTAQVAAWKPGQTIFITNSLPYAYRLEYDGWSRQAPAGMVRVTVVEFAQRFERAVRAAKGAR